MGWREKIQTQEVKQKCNWWMSITNTLWSKHETNLSYLAQKRFQWIPAYVTLIHMNMLSLKSVHEGFQDLWPSIAEECAKPNLKYFLGFFSWQAIPVFGG
jgi:hypothetical protein